MCEDCNDCLDSCKFNPDEPPKRRARDLQGGIVTKPQITLLGHYNSTNDKEGVIPLARGGVLSKEQTLEIMNHGKIVESQTGHLETSNTNPSFDAIAMNTFTGDTSDVFAGKPATESMGVYGQITGTTIVVKQPIIENIDPTVPKAGYSTPNSAGMDLYTRVTVTIHPSKSLAHVVTKIPLNVKIDPTCTFGASCYAMLVPRSSTCLKYGIMLANNCGIIDSDYRGEIAMLAYNLTDHTITIPKGSKIAQLLFMQNVRVDFTEGVVAETGEHLGFGSTGN